MAVGKDIGEIGLLVQGAFASEGGLKRLLQAVLNRAMEEEAAIHVGAGRHERSAERCGYRKEVQHTFWLHSYRPGLFETGDFLSAFSSSRLCAFASSRSHFDSLERKQLVIKTRSAPRVSQIRRSGKTEPNYLICVHRLSSVAIFFFTPCRRCVKVSLDSIPVAAQQCANATKIPHHYPARD